MATSLKSASTILLFTITSLVVAASPVCTLKEFAPASSTCGTYGVITKFDYFIEDLYDPQYASVLFCASECARRSNCKSFNLRIGQDPFCELHSDTQRQDGFVAENNATRTASSYQGFDLACFSCVNDSSAQGLASDASSSLSTGTCLESHTSSQGMTSSGISAEGTPSTTSSSSTSGTQSLSGSISIAQSTNPSASLTSSSTSSAAPTTTPYICNEDNCYRALLRFGDQAKAFCSGYTTVTNLETASVPAYLDNCSSNPTMISSGCSCLATWISPDPPPTLSSSAASPTSASGSQSSVISSTTSTVSDPISTSPVSSSSSTSSSVSASSSAAAEVTNFTGNSTTGTSQSTTPSASSSSTFHRDTRIHRHANATSARSSTSVLHVNTSMPLSSSLASSISRSSSADPTISSSNLSISTLIRELAVPTTTTESVTKYMISTVYATSVHTFKECPSTLKVCHIGLVTTTRVPVTTTFAPIIKVVVPRPTIDFIPPGYAMEPIYEVHVDIVNEQCPPDVRNCPAIQTVTRTIEAGSAVCPCPTTDAQVHREEHREKVCYQARPPAPAPEVKAIAMPVQEFRAVALSVEAHPAPPAMTSPSMVTITSTDKTTTKTMTYPIDNLPPPPCGLSLDAFDYKEEAYWAECPDYISTTTPMPKPVKSTPVLPSPSMVTITSSDKLSTKTMTFPIDQLPPPPCGLSLDAFDYKEEASWAECPDYTSTTTPMPKIGKPTPVFTSPSMVTITSTDKTSTKTMTYPIDQLPPPPCGLSLDAFMYKEEAYWAECPDYTSTTTTSFSVSMVTVTITDETTTRTVTATWNSAFQYQEEALWTWPGEKGSPWSLPPPATDTPTGFKLATTGPEWWKEPAFQSTPTSTPKPMSWKLPPVATGLEKKPMVSPLPPNVEKVPMKEEKKSAGVGVGAGMLSAVLAIVGGVLVVLL
ncbi:hypothetical protein BKA64DRAFT_746167 [Cadophora sp. MPI-SDFR-AT-0126]|nr:hypothetical protein BKA64DRAFT_746167 [Leotiomycetes sp. MPI-SDFR-AT-0126]